MPRKDPFVRGTSVELGALDWPGDGPRLARLGNEALDGEVVDGVADCLALDETGCFGSRAVLNVVSAAVDGASVLGEASEEEEAGGSDASVGREAEEGGEGLALPLPLPMCLNLVVSLTILMAFIHSSILGTEGACKV